MNYRRSLELSRKSMIEEARIEFEKTLSDNPKLCKAWVSYAQMEKRIGNMPKCRSILRKGIKYNPESSCIIQALGLHEMQRDNLLLANELLKLAVILDPKNKPVLKWKRIQDYNQ